MALQRICVFAGSNPGKRPEYREAARELGKELVAQGLGVVYGGGSVGLMGTLADSVLEHGGEIIGVMPQGLFRREIAHAHLTKLFEVESMHARKALMADLADGFIALPGGFGTFDELFEITTWAQIGIHNKPVCLLNIAHYFEPLLALAHHASNEGFIPPTHLKLLMMQDNVKELITQLLNYQPYEREEKWIELPPAR
jgi:uncharacterized protein (TIGR00730 family)